MVFSLDFILGLGVVCLTLVSETQVTGTFDFRTDVSRRVLLREGFAWESRRYTWFHLAILRFHDPKLQGGVLALTQKSLLTGLPLTMDSNRQTVSDGCAPTPIQYRALTSSSLMSLCNRPDSSYGSALGIGSYVPITSRGRLFRAVLEIKRVDQLLVV